MMVQLVEKVPELSRTVALDEHGMVGFNDRINAVLADELAHNGSIVRRQ